MSNEELFRPRTGDSPGKYGDREPVPYKSYRCTSEVVTQRNQEDQLAKGLMVKEPERPLTLTHHCKSHRDRCLDSGKHACICGKTWPVQSATEKEKI